MAVQILNFTCFVVLPYSYFYSFCILIKLMTIETLNEVCLYPSFTKARSETLLILWIRINSRDITLSNCVRRYAYGKWLGRCKRYIDTSCKRFVLFPWQETHEIGKFAHFVYFVYFVARACHETCIS